MAEVDTVEWKKVRRSLLPQSTLHFLLGLWFVTLPHHSVEVLTKPMQPMLQPTSSSLNTHKWLNQ